MAYKYEELTEKIIAAFYHVYHALGYGFLEKVYENALTIELRKRGLTAVQQPAIRIKYDGQVVGDYFGDILVENCILIEMKAVDALLPEHEAQLLNCLRGSEYDVGLLLNAGRRPEVKRKTYETARHKGNGTGADNTTENLRSSA
jgi:GxxExxY protein